MIFFVLTLSHLHLSKKYWSKFQCHQIKKHKKYPWVLTQCTLIVGHKNVTQNPCCLHVGFYRKLSWKKGFRTRGAKIILFFHSSLQWIVFIEFLSPSRVNWWLLKIKLSMDCIESNQSVSRSINMKKWFKSLKNAN